MYITGARVVQRQELTSFLISAVFSSVLYEFSGLHFLNMFQRLDRLSVSTFTQEKSL